MQIRKVNHIFRLLDETGAGIGNKDAIANYSSNVTSFFISPGESLEVFAIYKLLWHIGTSGAIVGSDYGDIGELTNGIIIRINRRDGQIINLTDTNPIKSNADLAHIADSVVTSSYPSGGQHVHAIFNFLNTGAPIVLSGPDRFEVICRDDLTGLADHHFMVQGYKL